MNSNKVDSIVAGFLEYLKKAGDLNLLPDIIRKLESRNNSISSTAKVVSTTVLTKDQREKIINILSKSFGVTKTEFEIDPSIVGGLKVSIGDEVIDLSVKNKLAYLNKSI